jgi:hypothetical protein
VQPDTQGHSVCLTKVTFLRREVLAGVDVVAFVAVDSVSLVVFAVVLAVEVRAVALRLAVGRDLPG